MIDNHGRYSLFFHSLLLLLFFYSRTQNPALPWVFLTWQRWEVSLHPVTAHLKVLLEEQGPDARREAVVKRRRSDTVSPPGVILEIKNSK